MLMTSKSRPPCGTSSNRCLICYKYLNLKEVSRWRDNQDLFSTGVIFTLKTLLQIPESLLESFLDKTGKAPVAWIGLCDGCVGMIAEAKLRHVEMMKVRAKLGKWQEQIISKLQRSASLAKNKVKGQRRQDVQWGAAEVTEECRKFVTDRGNYNVEDPFVVEDAAVFTKRLLTRLSDIPVPDKVKVIKVEAPKKMKVPKRMKAPEKMVAPEKMKTPSIYSRARVAIEIKETVEVKAENDDSEDDSNWEWESPVPEQDPLAPLIPPSPPPPPPTNNILQKPAGNRLPQNPSKPSKSRKKSGERQTCDISGKQVASAYKLRLHRKFIHEGAYPFHCKICGKGVRNETALTLHQAQVHKMPDESGEIHRCEVAGCRRYYSSKTSLEMHTALDHHVFQKGAKFECTWCGKLFHERYKWEQHELAHVNYQKKPFKCETCGKGFANHHNRRYHQLYTHKVARLIERRKREAAKGHLKETTNELIAS